MAASAQETPTGEVRTEPAVPAKFACKGKNKAGISTKDGQSIDAMLISLDATGVDYQEKSPIDGDVKGRVAWPLLSAASANAVIKAGVDPQSAEQLVLAGRVLQALPDGGAREADKWYALALKADPACKAQVEAARKAPPPFPPALETGKVTRGLAKNNPEAWQAESGGSMRSAVGEAVGMTNQALAACKISMSMNQNNLFVLYSDLPEADTKKWAGRFNSIYAGMSKAFGCSTANIWHGKAVVLLFKSQEEYARYLASAFHANMAGSAGVCVSRSDGMVFIAMFQDARNPDLEYVLYHEFAHGFLHRYNARTPVQSWANEGLAEFMASRFTHANHSETQRVQNSVDALKKEGSFEDFFAAQNIQGKHYGVAGDITRMLVECSPQRYGAFLGWLKQGANADTALTNSYGITAEGLVEAYGKRIGAKGLRSH